MYTYFISFTKLGAFGLSRPFASWLLEGLAGSSIRFFDDVPLDDISSLSTVSSSCTFWNLVNLSFRLWTRWLFGTSELVAGNISCGLSENKFRVAKHQKESYVPRVWSSIEPEMLILFRPFAADCLMTDSGTLNAKYSVTERNNSIFLGPFINNVTPVSYQPPWTSPPFWRHNNLKTRDIFMNDPQQSTFYVLR